MEFLYLIINKALNKKKYLNQMEDLAFVLVVINSDFSLHNQTEIQNCWQFFLHGSVWVPLILLVKSQYKWAIPSITQHKFCKNASAYTPYRIYRYLCSSWSPTSELDYQWQNYHQITLNQKISTILQVFYNWTCHLSGIPRGIPHF